MAEEPVYDFVIVGSGPAGCVVAEKLSRKFACLVLEAGPEYSDHPVAHCHDTWFTTYTTPELHYDYTTVPQSHLEDARKLEPKMGKLLGGSSSHNAMMWARGHPEDFERWEKVHGCSGWNWDTVLKAYMALEKTDIGEDALHGRRGHIDVKESPKTVVYEAFASLCRKKGIPVRNDLNGKDQLGGGGFSFTSDSEWKRVSGYTAFLEKQRDSRETLTVKASCTVTRVLFDTAGDAPTAVGVEYTTADGTTHTAKAAKEVILSAGALNTPQLLMLSGVGDAGHLQTHGITPVADLPGVGLHLQDHIFTAGFCSVKQNLPPSASWGAFLVFGKNDGTWEDGGRPDYQVMFGARENYLESFPKPPGFEDKQVMLMAACCLHPESWGSVRLASADPKDPPKINPNYMVNDKDVLTARKAHQKASELALGLADWVDTELSPAAETTSDLDDYIRKTGASMWHPVGTCKMGSDPMAVVNTECQVKGVRQLRVVDASVIPELPSGNTQAPVYAVGEIASEKILRAHNGAHKACALM